MIVTDFRWFDPRYNKERVGYYMDEFLALNLMGIPTYLSKSYDVVGIISGHGKVRVGKLLPYGSNILLSNGEWMDIKNIKVGDKIISPATDGKSSTISNVIEVIHHKNNEMCEIKNWKGDLLYTCCVDHQIPVRTLWLEKNRGKIEYIWKDEVYSASELLNKDKQWYKNHCPKSICSPMINKYNQPNCEIDPYLMGLYLGDGHVASKNRIGITNPDKNILSWLSERYTITRVNNRACPTIIISYNANKLSELCGQGSFNKRIPKEALLSDSEYRLKLMSGLIDTDGYLNKKGFLVYTTASKRLANDVYILAKTLGCKATIKNIYKNCQSFKDKRLYYNVNINITNIISQLSILREIKTRRIKDINNNNYNNDNHFERIFVNKINNKMDGCCIQVDSQSKLYITDNYSVTHNSTLAQQIAYFTAWMIAGGIMMKKESTGKWVVVSKPKKAINFNLHENIAFAPSELQAKARELFYKYGPNQVIVYDEGRAGLDSTAAMSVINKAMQDFFQECGQYGHVILIVLPNFFKLHEDYAISRSMFLVDVFTNKRMERGFFNFYNETQKEVLYLMGKKKTGTLSRYGSVIPSFKGRFGPFMPLDKEEYEEAKRLAIKRKEIDKFDGIDLLKMDRIALLYILNHDAGIDIKEIAEHLSRYTKTEHDTHKLKLYVDQMEDRLRRMNKKREDLVYE